MTPAERNKKYREKLKTEVLYSYGGKCVCCGETEPLFLTLDHVNNDGADHREQTIGCRRGNTDRLWIWARVNNYPDILQIMCWNCNCGKQRNGGICPHAASGNNIIRIAA